MTLYCPPKVSEVPDSPVEDCAPSADLMAANKGSLGAYPANRAGREAIRTATGKPHGGLTVADLNRANSSLFGFQLAVLSIPFARFVDDYMGTDYGAVLLGTAGRLPAHYRRHDPGFAGGHAVYVQGTSPAGVRATGKLWWMDPLAPWSYRGEWIDVADVRAYAWGIGQSGLVREGAWLPTSGGPNQGDDVTLAISNPAPGTLSLAKGRQLYDLAGNPLTKMSVDAEVPTPLGVIIGAKRYRAVEVTTGGVLQLLLADTIGFTPTPPADCSDEVAAAITADRATARIVYG